MQAELALVLNRIEWDGADRDIPLAFLANYLQSGDAALLKLRNYFGQVVGLAPLSSVYLRRGKGRFVLLQPNGLQREIPEEDVIWLAQYDPEQQVYGLPDYLRGLQSALLNRDATLFRRKCFLNGATWGSSSTPPIRTWTTSRRRR